MQQIIYSIDVSQACFMSALPAGMLELFSAYGSRAFQFQSCHTTVVAPLDQSKLPYKQHVSRLERHLSLAFFDLESSLFFWHKGFLLHLSRPINVEATTYATTFIHGCICFYASCCSPCQHLPTGQMIHDVSWRFD